MIAPALEDAGVWLLHDRLWGLSEVIEHNARRFFGLTSHLTQLRSGIDRWIVEAQVQGARKIPAISRAHADYSNAESLIQSLCEEIETIGMPVSKVAANRIKAKLETGQYNLKPMKEDVGCLIQTVQDELSLKLFFQLRDDDAQIYRTGVDDFFGSNLVFLSTEAYNDARSACECFALGQFAASSYHSMGVVEQGVKAVCLKLPVTLDLDASDCTWNKMIHAIESEIRAKGNAAAPRKISHPATWANDEQFFNRCVTEISAIAKAFRNPAMHFRRSRVTNPTDARSVLTLSGEFMKHLAVDLQNIP
ncbi:MAG: hypothetical protein ACYC96_09795 [Fimbriimonadaceae bacterium]